MASRSKRLNIVKAKCSEALNTVMMNGMRELPNEDDQINFALDLSTRLLAFFVAVIMKPLPAVKRAVVLEQAMTALQQQISQELLKDDEDEKKPKIIIN